MAPSSTRGAVADAVRRLFANKQFKAKDVAASLSGNSVIVKKITLPVMSERELSESIYWEAEQYIPFDIQDVNLDYEIIDRHRRQRQGTMEVLLVAAKKDKIADYTSVITQAGRTPVIVDVDAFALQNAYEANYGFEPGGVVVLLNAGASAININILRGSQSVFTRDVSMGGNAFTEAVQKELSLPFDAAETAEERAGRRRRDLRRRAAGAEGDDRQRAARSREDVRLLQGDGVERSHRSHRAERRRVARRGLRRGAARAVRHRGGSLRSVPPGGVRREARLGSTHPDETWRRSRPWRSGLALRKVGDR